MKKFKLYLETQLKIATAQLESAKKTISDFPQPKDINLSDYQDINQIKKEYLKTIKPNIIKHLLGPSKRELQNYIHRTELGNLESTKESYIQRINQITEYINESDETGLTKPINTDNTIFILMLDYAVSNSINPKELLKAIINLCRYSVQRDNMHSKIKQNISSFFDNNNQLINKEELNSLKMILKKFFELILGTETQTKYKIVLEQLYLELDMTIKLADEENNQANLLEKRQTLIELQKYINGLKISKTLDIPTFTNLLNKAEVPLSHQEKLITLMQQRITDENKKAEQAKMQSTIEHFLNNEEKELLELSAQLEHQVTGPILHMLKRARKDVISMCKYISIADTSINFHETIEVLSDRLRVLKSVVSNIETKRVPSNALFYITTNEGLPLILRSIELYEVYDYNTIYNLLYRAATSNEAKKVFTINRIDFYALTSNQTKLIYAEIKGKRIIVELSHSQPTNKIKKHITEDILKQIEEIASKGWNEEFKNIHATYESVILECINVKGTEQPLSLKKV